MLALGYPAGTFASIEPAPTCTILNRSGVLVTAILIGIQPEGGYEPSLGLKAELHQLFPLPDSQVDAVPVGWLVFV